MAEVLAMRNDTPFSHAPLHRSTSQTSFFDSGSSYSTPRKNSYSHSDLRGGSLSSSQTSSFHSTPSSSLSLDTRFDDDDESDDESDDEGIAFPSYSKGTRYSKYEDRTHDTPPSSPVVSNRAPPSPAEADPIASSTSTPDFFLHSEDDTAVRSEPSHHVDYLSHEWKEEDIWSSWRHIVEHRKVYGERSRLENASWRTWAKSQFKLNTISPETLNWLKDCDVTWLYGPLQPASHRSYSQNAWEPASRLSKTNSFLHKKPILKKRSMSEVMLQKSISASSLVKQAAAAVQAQQTSGHLPERRRYRPMMGRATSDFGTSSFPSCSYSRASEQLSSSRSSTSVHTPDNREQKHIRFDTTVEQCIAINNKDDDEEDDHDHWTMHDEDESDDEGLVMMKRSNKKRPLSRTNSRTSMSGESKSILKLPATTLKPLVDSPDVADRSPSHSLGYWRTNHLSPSPSQETLRPSNPSSNFLLPEDDDEDEDPWEPSAAFGVKRPATPTQQNPNPDSSTLKLPAVDGESSDSGGLRRTESGMFMPFEDEDEDPAPSGLIGRVVDTVNTARDIIHVVWNVGWRS